MGNYLSDSTKSEPCVGRRIITPKTIHDAQRAAQGVLRRLIRSTQCTRKVRKNSYSLEETFINREGGLYYIVATEKAPLFLWPMYV